MLNAYKGGFFMILADVYVLLNDIFFEVVRFLAIAALIVLAVFLGSRLRKLTDKIKASKEKNSLDEDSAQ